MIPFIDEVMHLSTDALATLAQDRKIGKYIDRRNMPRPYLGTGPIKLVIIGQDPTVQRSESRDAIKVVLNLDKKNSLTRYISGEICRGLGLSLTEHVYATNLCKNFFTAPPTAILNTDNVDVIARSASVWLSILEHELTAFPEATLISLGEPLLSVLVRPEFSRKVRYYWGYSGKKDHDLSAINVDASTLNRQIFPFPHQPSLRKTFYRDNLASYIAFVRAASS
jgi:hypothetical protein